ncbi:uncharacterized protein LOC112085344 [Eutrema salsugineum]|uniref:uncharacterized protein LOC112085344 n=1 Tax=Eutrema salsugineum TaxID=72664 RepID=UPI000CED6DC2|nr:uncharacterized protein LOC112085344 [Eutrema salsugineum]
MSRFPKRLFALGNEPENKKVNTYFQLHYLDTISYALEEDHIEKLSLSQFGKLIEAGNKIASSVRFLHFILSRQLVTKKNKEVWCLFAVQPIRFSIREFAITTGLDCSKLPPPKKLKEDKVSEYTIELFGSDRNATPGWIATTLAGRPYKDKDTRFKLACLLLIDASNLGQLPHRTFVSQHVLFRIFYMHYRWSFWSVLKAKSSKPTLTDEEDEEDESPSIRPGAMKPVNISMPHVKFLDNNQKVAVKAILPDDEHLLDDTDLEFDDDVPDESVDNLVAAINNGQNFSRKTWNGGEKENLHIKHPKTPASSSRNTSSDVDLDTAASSIVDKVKGANAVVLTEIKSLRADFVVLCSEVSSTLSTFKEYIQSLEGPSSQVGAPSKGKPARRVKSTTKKVKHVRFQQVSSSEESKSSSDHATKTKDSSSTSAESNDGFDSTVGDGVEANDGDDQEDRTEDDDGVDVSNQMQVDVDDVQNDVTLASNQIAFVLSDLSETVQVNVDPSETQPILSPPVQVNLDPSESQPKVSENQSGSVNTRQMGDDGVTHVNTSDPPYDQVLEANDQTDVNDVAPIDSGLPPQDPVVKANDQTGADKDVPPEPQDMLETQNTILEPANPEAEIEIPAGVDPPGWSLGLT